MSDMAPDPEIAAMGSVSAALAPLDEEQQGRVLRWAADRYGLTSLKFTAPEQNGVVEDQDETRGAGAAGQKTYSTIDELFENGAAKTNMQKALLAAYWFQVVEGGTGFQSYVLNTALKNMGQGIPNITDALGSAESQKPALVMQTAKTGKARQARKTYKLTTAGVKFVEGMLSGSAD